jgi:transcriptional regulator with XRE-family HTH domain
MRRIRIDGAKVKRLRQDRLRGSTQKELAHEIRISERKLRAVENSNAAIPADVAERLARALNMALAEFLLAAEIVQPEPPPVPAVPCPLVPPREIIPRHDTTIASVVRDEAALFKMAHGYQVIVSHFLTPLTAETSACAEELLTILRSLTWPHRSPLEPMDGIEELAVRRRIRELLVLLKGNDVWVYADTNFKTLPESFDVQPKSSPRQYEMQVIVAFGPPGEYGETSLEVPIDHGQPIVLQL